MTAQLLVGACRLGLFRFLLWCGSLSSSSSMSIVSLLCVQSLIGQLRSIFIAENVVVGGAVAAAAAAFFLLLNVGMLGDLSPFFIFDCPLCIHACLKTAAQSPRYGIPRVKRDSQREMYTKYIMYTNKYSYTTNTGEQRYILVQPTFSVSHCVRYLTEKNKRCTAVRARRALLYMQTSGGTCTTNKHTSLRELLPTCNTTDGNQRENLQRLGGFRGGGSACGTGCP